MSFGAITEQQGRGLFDEEGARAGIWNALSRLGMNPAANMFARQLFERSGELRLLMNAMNVGPEQAQQFIDQWVGARMGRGGAWGGSGLDTASISRNVQGLMGISDPNNPLHAAMRSGDPSADFQLYASLAGLGRGNESPLFQQARQRLLQQQYARLMAGRYGPGGESSGYIVDDLLGRPAASPAASGGGQNYAGGTPGFYPPAQPKPPATAPVAGKPAVPGAAGPRQGGTGGSEGAYRTGSSSGVAANQAQGFANLAYGQAPAVGQETMPGSRLPDNWSYRPPAGTSDLYAGGNNAASMPGDGQFVGWAPQGGGRAGSQADFRDPGGWELYQRLTPQDVEAFQRNWSGEGSVGRGGMNLAGGAVAYNPGADTARHWWGKTKNTSKGYSGAHRVQYFYNDAIQRGWDPRTALAQALARARRVFNSDPRAQQWGWNLAGF